MVAKLTTWGIPVNYCQIVETGTSAEYCRVGRLEVDAASEPTCAIQTVLLEFRSPKIMVSLGFGEEQA